MGNDGLREAAKEAKPVILELIMGMEVVMPENKLGDLVSDTGEDARLRIEQ